MSNNSDCDISNCNSGGDGDSEGSTGNSVLIPSHSSTASSINGLRSNLTYTPINNVPTCPYSLNENFNSSKNINNISPKRKVEKNRLHGDRISSKKSHKKSSISSSSHHKKKRKRVVVATDLIHACSQTVRYIIFALVVGLLMCMIDLIYIWGTLDTEGQQQMNYDNTKNNNLVLSVSSASSSFSGLVQKTYSQFKSKFHHLRRSALETNDRETGDAIITKGESQQHMQPGNSEGDSSNNNQNNITSNKTDVKIEDEEDSEEDRDLTDIDEYTELIGFSNYNPETDTSGGKGPILQLVIDAMKLDSIDKLDKDIIQKLPTVHEVIQLYGQKPLLYGLDTCQSFQKSGKHIADHFLSTAGTFNTGTNVMAELLIANCYMPSRYKKYHAAGVRWQVLWGKHTPITNETYRQTHIAYHDPAALTIHADDIFPAVTIRDPFQWMQSMCRNEYSAHWQRDDANETHCPNLVHSMNVNGKVYDDISVPVLVKYKDFMQYHDSLVHFWNAWYSEYFAASFPRLMVRYEDVIFHPKEVTKIVCECAGGKLRYPPSRFVYIADSAKQGKAHGSKEHKTSYVDALIKYGTVKGRYNGYLSSDLQYATRKLDTKLMDTFGYLYPNETINFTIATEAVPNGSEPADQGVISEVVENMAINTTTTNSSSDSILHVNQSADILQVHVKENIHNDTVHSEIVMANKTFVQQKQ